MLLAVPGSRLKGRLGSLEPGLAQADGDREAPRRRAKEHGADRSLEIHETKGHWEDDARVKIKVAAEALPIFRFVALKRRSKKDGGGWSEEAFG